jgi:hypothetical protein
MAACGQNKTIHAFRLGFRHHDVGVITAVVFFSVTSEIPLAAPEEGSDVLHLLLFEAQANCRPIRRDHIDQSCPQAGTMHRVGLKRGVTGRDPTL